MRRGEVWTVAGAKDYAGKPRPSLILQNNRFDETESITVCGFTSDVSSDLEFRVTVYTSEENGLLVPSDVMIDKISTVSREKLGRRIGKLTSNDIEKLDRAAIIFLGVKSFGSDLES